MERDPATRAQQRTLAGAPCSEGAFAKRRAIAIDDAMAAGQETREEQRRRSSFGEVSRAASTEPVAVSAAVATKVRKRARDAKAAHEQADARAAMQRQRCNAKPLAAFTGRQGPSDGAASAPPGIALVKVAAKDAFAKLREHNFKVSHDPIDFIDQVLRSRVRSPNRGHLVLASAVAHNDFAVAARLLAVLLGTYLADPADFLKRGVQVRALLRGAVQAARAASPRGRFSCRQHQCSLGARHLAADCHVPRVQSAIPL